jgi:hypothetical protein
MSKNHELFALNNPQVYSGFVTKFGTSQAEGITWSVIDAANYHDLPEILERYGIWAICEDGIYSLYVTYCIDKSRLFEDDWISHLSDKTWVTIKDFSEAYKRALVLLK